MNYSVIIPCAGMGKRMGLGYNKLRYQVEGKSIIEKTAEIFIQDERCKQIILVISKEDESWFKEKFIHQEKVEMSYGGKERQDSVYQGLLKTKENHVLIHDGARPYLSMTCINRLLETLTKEKACLLMVPAKDTIKVVEDGYICHTPARESLMHAQTPQAFLTSVIMEAHQLAQEKQVLGTDDASLVEMFLNIPVKGVLGDYANIKITTKEDIKK